MILRGIILAGLVWAAAPAVAQNESGIAPFSAEDQDMNAAIAEAQQSLPLFLCASLDADGYGPQGGFLKVSVPVDDARMGNEIIWVGPFAGRDSDTFTGLLANDPIAIPDLAAGDQFDFSYDMIVDWAWSHPSGAQYGHYTTRVIMRQKGETEMLARFADPAFDSDWTCP